MSYDQPDDSPPLRDDLFPAKVYAATTPHASAPEPPDTATNYVPSGAHLLYQPARVLLSADRIWVFTDSADGPELVLHAALDDVAGSRRQGFRVTIAPTDINPHPEYPDLVVTRLAHCGCGSRLRSFRPFRLMRLIAY